MRQVFVSKSGRILVENRRRGTPWRVLLIHVAYSLISTSYETSAVAVPRADLPNRMRHATKLARMGWERLRERGLEETLRKARVREASPHRPAIALRAWCAR